MKSNHYTHSLYYKLLIGYLIFGLLGFIAIATISSEMTYHHLVERESEVLYDEATMIADRCSKAYEGKTINLDSAYPQIEAVSAYLQSDIWILNHEGTIVADSSDSRTGITIDDFDPTAQGNRLYSIGQYYNLFDSKVLSVSAPITGNMKTYGYIVIHMPIQNIEAEQNGFLNIIYITSIILFFLSLVVLLVFTKVVYFPLKKITVAANEYAAGNLAHNIPITTHDEIGYLASTLNYMSSELNEMEQYQHNFIANVSHDFRSPLTSIKGYLEAILDGTIPQELYHKYLHIVISETERLNKLTQGMLTLNSLDSKGYLTRTNFDINRTIKDTAATFEGTCSAKGITFDLTFADSIQMVYADLGKIQQVLYNLIDNAIKFSHEDSIIYIQTSIRYEKIFISVKDTGIGIPKDSQKKIFERFYKTDLSRGKDKKGTGLGLAIVKEIIQAHGENIDVVSTEGVGTEFIFSLPKATAL
ncbi:cell wall metabolism sensor histidine kinase WalK [uncultured Clostridium sp.]|uniref:sensor histidine kinase n=1 Tax=uncultured Clostridium sp. TaxID=59620 RepID=UPI002599B183|nr:HAMP domain-containing sensor histidine kinase [uncultured Clostridium sp.]